MFKLLEWRQKFPELAGISDEVSAILDMYVRTRRFAKGARLFGPERPMQSLVLPVAGTIRVQRPFDAGAGTILYRLRAGEACMATAACHMSFGSRSVEGVAETDVEVIQLPRDAFDELMVVSQEFRGFIFDACSRRITDLLVVIEETLFNRVDVRLAEKLIELRSAADTVNRTCQRLSVELGTALEVISRHLSEFERRGWVSLGGGSIKLTDAAAIRDFAETT